MKITLFLFLLLPFVIYGQSQTVDTVSYKDLVYKDYHGTALPEPGTLAYKSNEDSPYTGMIVDTYDNGQNEYEAYMVDGRIEGLSTQWYESGQMKMNAIFKDGGMKEFSTWHENGHKHSEGNSKIGGLRIEWH